MNVKEYELRKLDCEDIFTLAEIFSKCGAEKMAELFSDINLKGSEAETGAAIWFGAVRVICENIGSAKKQIIELLASLYGKSTEEIKALSPARVILLVRKLFDSEDIRDFFTEALRWLCGEQPSSL